MTMTNLVLGLTSSLTLSLTLSLTSSLTDSQTAGRIEVTAKSRAVQPGELVVLTMIAPVHVDQVRVHAFGHEVATFTTLSPGDRTWQALVGIDLGAKPGAYPVAIDAGAGQHTTYEL